jgi:hypothetical protein
VVAGEARQPAFWLAYSSMFYILVYAAVIGTTCSSPTDSAKLKVNANIINGTFPTGAAREAVL